MAKLRELSLDELIARAEECGVDEEKLEHATLGSTVTSNTALSAELETMRPGARRKRAVAAGATEEEVEEADDATDPAAAVSALVVKYELPQPDEQAAGPYLEAEEEIIKFRMSQTADR